MPLPEDDKAEASLVKSWALRMKSHFSKALCIPLLQVGWLLVSNKSFNKKAALLAFGSGWCLVPS